MYERARHVARSMRAESDRRRGNDMNCGSCGAALVDGATFCGACGTRTPDPGVLRISLDDLDTPPQSVAPPPIAAQPLMQAPVAPPPRAPLPAVAPQGLHYAQGSMVGARPPQYAGAIIGALGAIAVIIGSLTSWVADTPTFGNSVTFNAFKIPFDYLVDDTSSGFTLHNNGVGILLVGLAVLGLATSFIPRSGVIRNICGVGVVIVAILYLIQTQSRLDASSFGSTNLGDLLGVGFYVTAVGGLVMAASPPRWR